MLPISLKKNVGFLKKKKFIYLLQKFKHLYFKTTNHSFFFDNNSVFQLEIKQKKINKNLLNFILLSDRLLLSSYLKFFIRTKGKIFLRKDCIFVINILNSLRFSSKLRYLSKFLRFRSMVYFFIKNKQKRIERSLFSVFKSKKKTSGSFYRYKLASKNILKLTINQLVLSNVYIGANTDFYNLALKPFLLQIESNFVIFNLKYTYWSLKLLVSFVIKIFSSTQKILIVNNSEFFRFTFLLKYKNIMYYDKK
jgi:hypothetical protein